MPIVVLAFLAAAGALAAIAVGRVWRVRSGRDARPDGLRLILVLLAVLIIPPIVLAILAGPPASRGQSPALDAGVAFFVAMILLATGMAVAGMLARRFAPESARANLSIGLTGREPSAYDVKSDPPLTAALQAGVNDVNAQNAAFPRGSAFLDMQTKPGFEAAWQSLDTSTRTLEGQISESLSTGIAVSSIASDTATDARSRLETLRRAAAAGGQVWAT